MVATHAYKLSLTPPMLDPEDTGFGVFVVESGIGWSRLVLSALLVSVIMAPAVYPVVPGAYEKDVHYYLTFFLAVATCFEPIEAYLIASGDLSVDKDSDVYPLPTVEDVKSSDYSRYSRSLLKFHAMGTKEEVDPILRRMKTGVHDSFRSEGPKAGVLVSYGIYLHALQDSFSHRGYTRIIGHLLDSLRGRDPDSLATNPGKSLQMAQATVADMLEVCGILKRQPRYIMAAKDPKLETLMEKLVNNSNPAWKKVDEATLAILILKGPKGVIVEKLLKELFKRLTGYNKPSEVEKVIIKNKNLLNNELKKIPGMAGRGIIGPTSFEIDKQGRPVVEPSGLVKMKDPVTDPSDLILLIESFRLKPLNETMLEASLGLTVFNGGDNVTSENLTLALVAMDSEDSVLAAVIESDAPLSMGDARGYELTLLVDLSEANFSDKAPIVLMAAAYGGPEDPDYGDNVALVLITPTLLNATSLLEEALEPPATATVTVDRTQTVTVTKDREIVTTVTITGYTTTLTLEKTVGEGKTSTVPLDWFDVEINARNLFLALIALLIVAVIIRLLRG